MEVLSFKGRLKGRLFHAEEVDIWIYVPWHIVSMTQRNHPAIAEAYQKKDGSWKAIQITPLPRRFAAGPAREPGGLNRG